MLASLLGVRLMLLTGDVPRPASAALLQAIIRVEVVNNAEGDDGFEITFSLTKQALGEYDLLQGGELEPETRVIIGVLMGASPEALIDGVIYHHQLNPSREPGASTLVVKGRDVRVMLDLKEEIAPLKNQPDSQAVEAILAKYPQYGFVSKVTPTTSIPIEIELTRWRHESDLALINRLARRNGFVFYVEPLTIGVNTAYWGPRQPSGPAQADLLYNVGGSSNVDEISFNNDALSPTGFEGKVYLPFIKQSIMIPPLPDLRIPPLAAKVAPPRRKRLMRRTANRSPADAATDMQAAAANAPDPVECAGKLDSVRYGQVLRARRRVRLVGTGLSYAGFYRVSTMRHIITRSEYSQEFTLKREGTGALL